MIYQSLQEYAATHYAPGSSNPLSERTVKRWLADDELPGANKDEAGRWRIPHDAVRTPRMTAQVVSMTTRQSDHSPVLSWTDQLTPLTSDLPVELGRDLIDRLPTFLTIPQSAYLLGISEGTLRNKENRRYFRIRKVDRQLMMPLSRLKKLRGLAG